MNWQFDLLDRNGTFVNIDEPVGWDACVIKIVRDGEKHGVFFDFQQNEFEFYDLACNLIKEEYDDYGFEGNLTLIISLSCDGSEPDELYRGRFSFTDYKYSCGDLCYVTIPMETTSDAMQFANRFDQKVNLQTDVAFDEVTELEPYDKLPFDINLPSKGIFLQDYSKLDDDLYYKKEFAIESGGSGGFGMLGVPFTKQVAGEIGDYFTDVEPFWIDCGIAADWVIFPNGGTGVVTNPTYISPVINFHASSPNYNAIEGTCRLSFKLKGDLKGLGATVISNVYLMTVKLPPRRDGEVVEDYEVIDQQAIYNDLPGSPLPPDTLLPFDLSVDIDLQLNQGDRIYHFIAMFAGTPEGASIEMNFEKDNFFKLTNLSHTPASVSKAFMVNEAFSRIAEAITDDKIRAYSEYFGRTDSQPYSVENDGCGGLEAITMGLFIRRKENRIPDKPFLMNVSMKDMWEGLDPVHHIGYGIEPDTNRPGYNRLRVEPWKHFYKNEVILVCDSVAKVDRQSNAKEAYSTFKFGYQKWEAEEYNGLDEFLTKREYRTTLSQVKNELARLSGFISSGYAWEITRRKDQESTDWRYDNDTFLVCLQRGATYQVTWGTGGFALKRYGLIPEWAVAGNSITITNAGANNGTYTISSVTGPMAGTGDVGILVGVATTPNAVLSSIFINTGSGLISVELGNVSSPANIIDPPTLYNYRISPIRIALRWMDKVFASYKHQGAGSRLLFTDGDGNYYAAGEMTSATCKWENGVLVENAAIDLDVFADPDMAAPLLAPERVEFEHPMSLKKFKEIQSNPYGLIEWFNDCEAGQGWIDNVSYRPEEGLADFTLIPKYL